MTYLNINLPLSMGNHLPIDISKNQTRNLTTGKCNIWRACVKEATIRAKYQGGIFSEYPKKEINHESQ